MARSWRRLCGVVQLLCTPLFYRVGHAADLTVSWITQNIFFQNLSTTDTIVVQVSCSPKAKRTVHAISSADINYHTTGCTIFKECSLRPWTMEVWGLVTGVVATGYEKSCASVMIG